MFLDTKILQKFLTKEIQKKKSYDIMNMVILNTAKISEGYLLYQNTVNKYYNKIKFS